MTVKVQIEDKYLVLTEAVITRAVQRASEVALDGLLFKHQETAQFVPVNQGQVFHSSGHREDWRQHE